MNDQDTTRIAAVAMQCAMGEPETNLVRVEKWAEKVHDEGATFAVFHEEYRNKETAAGRTIYKAIRDIRCA